VERKWIELLQDLLLLHSLVLLRDQPHRGGLYVRCLALRRHQRLDRLVALFNQTLLLELLLRRNQTELQDVVEL
jgi:hypothetical protein